MTVIEARIASFDGEMEEAFRFEQMMRYTCREQANLIGNMICDLTMDHVQGTGESD
jgi:hypothetical protein